MRRYSSWSFQHIGTEWFLWLYNGTGPFDFQTPCTYDDDEWWLRMTDDDWWWFIMTNDDCWWPIMTDDDWWRLMMTNDDCWWRMVFDLKTWSILMIVEHVRTLSASLRSTMHAWWCSWLLAATEPIAQSTNSYFKWSPTGCILCMIPPHPFPSAASSTEVEGTQSCSWQAEETEWGEEEGEGETTWSQTGSQVACSGRVMWNRV